jgi:succinate dehydrogenase / fumarate reductase cytochrome b subunit
MSASPTSPAVHGLHVPVVAWVFSSIGKKTIVALSGMGLLAFAVGHLAGNMTFFVGPDAINAYAVKLRELGPLLWVARIGLLVLVGAHIYFTMLLWSENQAARPRKYAVFAPMRTTVFARTMRLTGLFVLGFVVFHLAHFTWGVVQPEWAHLKDAQGRHDVFAMLVHGFRNPVISIVYVVSLFLLAAHLSHGIGSLFQTLGLSTSRLRPLYELSGRGIAWALFLGYASIPLSVLVFGYGKDVVR